MRSFPTVLAAAAGLAAALLPCGLRADPLPAGCADLTAMLADLTGYDLDAPLRVEDDGRCTAGSLRFEGRHPDQPDLIAEGLWLKGASEGGDLVTLDLQLDGLEFGFGLGDTAPDARLKSLFRLQSADLRLFARRDDKTGLVRVTGPEIRLSGGAILRLSGDIAAASLTVPALLAGRLDRLDLDLKTDPRLARMILQAVGEDLGKPDTDQGAVLLAKEALAAVVAAAAQGLVPPESHEALDRFVAALPDGHGWLRLSLQSQDGIALSDFLILGLSGKPSQPDILALLAAEGSLTATWTPGIQP